MSQHKRIAISGASSGIGAACAHIFAKRNYDLFLGARRLGKLSSIAEACISSGASKVQIHSLDVRDDSSCASFCESAGTRDVVILNAGLALGTDHVATGQVNDWTTVIDTNIMGVLRLARLFLPAMIARKDGHIVLLSSIAAHQVYEGGAVYAATKHAIRAIAQTLKLELNGHNIRVSTIDPGLVETEFSLVRFDQDSERAKKVYQGLRPLSAEDIADAVAYVVNAPPHVNIDQMIITPTSQASVYKVARST